MQADFLALDLARVAGHETGLSQRLAQGFVIGNQGAGNAVANSAGLPRDAAAADRDPQIKTVGQFRRLQRLAHDHLPGFTAKVLLEGFIVDRNLTVAAP